MKISYVTPWKGQSGVASYTSELVDAISTHNSVSAMIVPWDGTQKEKVGAPISRFKELVEIAKKSDIVHVQFVMGEFYPHFLPLASLACQIGGSKLAVTFHEHYMYDGIPFSKILNANRLIQSFLVDIAFVHSDVESEFQPSLVSDMTHVVPHGVSVSENRVSIDNRCKAFLIPGFISENKDYETVIRAFSKIYNRVPEFHLELVGSVQSKEYLHSIHDLCDEMGVTDRVKINSEYIPDDEFEEKLSKCWATIIAQPKRASSSGTLAHAIGKGTPTIISESPALQEYTQDAGLVFPHGNVDILAEKMAKIAESRQMWEDTSSSLYDVASEYHWRYIAKRYIDIFKRCL